MHTHGHHNVSWGLGWAWMQPGRRFVISFRILSRFQYVWFLNNFRFFSLRSQNELPTFRVSLRSSRRRSCSGTVTQFVLFLSFISEQAGTLFHTKQKWIFHCFRWATKIRINSSFLKNYFEKFIVAGGDNGSLFEILKEVIEIILQELGTGSEDVVDHVCII